MTEETGQEELTPEKENEQIAVRRDRLKELREAGEAYPKSDAPANNAAELLEKHADDDAEKLETAETKAEVSGRLMTVRGHGKTMFAHLKDGTGKIQLYIRKDVLGDDAYAEVKKLDIGDIVKVAGTLMRTRTGELTVKAESVTLLTKSLRPLPEKWHGLKDVETRFRQRYVDLIVNDEAKATFEKRAKVVKTIRRFLEDRGFMEVETPMMHDIPGGASAKPFTTHHNALDMELHLRVAPELHLKRLIVGGYEKVFEINRSFRNEGIDTTHNPEFTMIEFYQAYSDYEKLMDLTEELIPHIAMEVNGTTKTVWGGNEIELGGKYARYSFFDSLRELGEIPQEIIENTEKAIAWLAERGVKPEKSDNPAKVLEKLFDYGVEPKLIQPTFIYDYPLALSPLAKKKPGNPELTERFEFFVGTKEIANAYSELNDPEDQYSRFKAQVDMREGGDDEAQWMDEDFITALEYGMPPTGGQGIGIDRLVMLLTGNDSIREVILFPQLKKRQ